MIASIAGELTDGKLSDRRPFRAPHHSASMAAMVGGGVRARPGEVSLAHNGVLFLDELPEFSPQVLDSLRQPLEAGECMVARANHRISYPSRIQLIAAMNPCRCGMAGEPGHQCRRGPRCASDYQARLSGPLLDRIDIRIEVPALAAADLIRPGASETSAEVRERVGAARALQSERYGGTAKVRCNAQAGADLIETVATPERAGMRLLEDAAQAMQLSARGYHRVLKLARTLADLDGAETVARIHVAEALSYRALPLDLQLAA
jgi:magnesium chelatase family protein